MQELTTLIPYINSKFFINNRGLQSPGLLKYHYNPQIPLYIMGEHQLTILNKKVGLLTFGAKKEKISGFLVKNLSATGYLKEAAINIQVADTSE